MTIIHNKLKDLLYPELNKIRYKAIQLALRSNHGVSCPICGYRGLTFLPFGLDKRPNAFCQRCTSKERQRLAALYLKKLQLNNGFRLLHVAPDAELSALLKHYYSFSEIKIDKGLPNYTYTTDTIHMDLTDLSFGENSFDLVLCLHVLMYIEEDIKAMQELYRVMANNAIALFTVSQDKKKKETFSSAAVVTEEDRHRYYGHPDNNKIYGADFSERLAAVGFDVTEFDVLENFSHNEIFQYGLNGSETLFIARKQL